MPEILLKHQPPKLGSADPVVNRWWQNSEDQQNRIIQAWIDTSPFNKLPEGNVEGIAQATADVDQTGHSLISLWSCYPSFRRAIIGAICQRRTLLFSEGQWLRFHQFINVGSSKKLRAITVYDFPELASFLLGEYGLESFPNLESLGLSGRIPRVPLRLPFKLQFLQLGNCKPNAKFSEWDELDFSIKDGPHVHLPKKMVLGSEHPVKKMTGWTFRDGPSMQRGMSSFRQWKWPAR
ncbi:hypothetical protein T439DRAFT_146282 [Meredithblackwellia eburnea MCA 4105]